MSRLFVVGPHRQHTDRSFFREDVAHQDGAGAPAGDVDRLVGFRRLVDQAVEIGAGFAGVEGGYGRAPVADGLMVRNDVRPSSSAPGRAACNGLPLVFERGERHAVAVSTSAPVLACPGRSTPSGDVVQAYGKDIHGRANEQACLMRAGRFELLDIEHIAAEIEDEVLAEKWLPDQQTAAGHPSVFSP